MEQLDYRGKPRSRYQSVNDEPSRTVQADAHQSDINLIVAKHQAGFLPVDEAAGVYADVSQFSDYADLLRNVKEAEREFDRLPNRARKVLGSVDRWLDALHDADKRGLLVEAGLVAADQVAAASSGAVSVGAGEPGSSATPAAPEVVK